MAGLESVQRTTYRLDLEYDGTDFCGWQIQPHLRTVQGCLESAAAVLFGEPVGVLAAGRTDTGVHATGQVAHCRVSRARPPDVVQRALNAVLPRDVRVKSVSIAAPDFHARYSACWRAYRYRIARHPVAVGRAYCWCYPHVLAVERMQEASEAILGNRQFRSFAHENEKETHYLSSVYRAKWRTDGLFYEFQIEANRFLHGMVRLLVGTFVRIGRGMIDADSISRILEAQDVKEAGPKAPARGLTLVAVGFEPWNANINSFTESAEVWC